MIYEGRSLPSDSPRRTSSPNRTWKDIVMTKLRVGRSIAMAAQREIERDDQRVNAEDRRLRSSW
jgi:hypothetical protein